MTGIGLAVRPALLTAPFFEIGPKNLLRLPDIIDVAEAAGRAGTAHGVTVVITAPTPLIAPVQRAVPGVLVFAQEMGGDELGASVGRTTAEALLDAGAAGVMLNHDSNPLDADALSRRVERAQSTGLLTMVCAGSDDEALASAALHPTVVLYEPPALIGAAGGGDRPWISQIDARVRDVDPGVLMMHAGGVATAGDAYDIMRAGAAGTGSTSGVLRAPSPADAAGAFIEAVRRGFDDRVRSGETTDTHA